MDRRAFLLACASAALAGCAKGKPPLPQGTLLGTRHALGHRLRAGGFPAPTQVRQRSAVVVGAGVSGLSAAWRFRHAGLDDFELIELESEIGGNARYGENAVSAYPWGAHYLTLPGPGVRATRRLLAELGVIQGDWQIAAPRYDERALCAAPQERLYQYGVWGEGLAPLVGATRAELDGWQRFHERVAQFKAMHGADGRRAFDIPLEHSSRDTRLLALDRMTMRDWLAAERLDVAPVRWLVDYACRDDFGCSPAQVSAWIGLHYFASRDARAQNAESDTVLTWPEGNGRLVRGLFELARPSITRDAIAYRALESTSGVTLDVYLPREERSVRIEAAELVWAAPLRFAAFALENADAGLKAALSEFDYAPWMVANLTLSDSPSDGVGAPLSWDNVLRDSPALGYVVATHQRPAADPGATVLTYYWSLAAEPPARARERLLATPRESWAEAVLADLEHPHPEIRELAQRLDVFAHGHGMVRPRPGLIWGGARERILARRGRIHFAHSDASGVSLFEEAQYRGVAAAERALTRLGGHGPTFL